MVIDWSPRARREFARLVSRTEQHSPKGAARIASRILERVDDLLTLADQGTPVGRNVRRLDVTRTPYLVFYRVKNETITVIGIVHGRQRRRR
jgi:plasmid stabilization system protein ParE